MSRKPQKVNGSPLAPAVEAQIDDNLRRVFEEDANQDLPERLRALVAQLGQQDTLSDTPDIGKDTDTATTGAAPPHETAIGNGPGADWGRR